MLMFVSVCTIVLYVLLKIYQKLTWGYCTSKKDLSGKTAIVTGGNTGIGLETAIDLCKRNAKVIIACRNAERAKSAVKRIQAGSGSTNVIYKILDLSSLSSVKAFAEDIIKTEKQLHILINNAAILGEPLSRTEDGLELNMATNHFGPFLLTNLLLGLMKKSAPARIVNVTSIVHGWISSMNIHDLNSENSFDRKNIYSYTKLANVLFTMELSNMLKNTGVTVNCLHPGTIQTELIRNFPLPVRLAALPLGYLCFKDAQTGAQTTLHCAVSEEVEGITGKYFSDCQITKPSKMAQDDGLAKKLWELSEKYTKLGTKYSANSNTLLVSR